MNITDKRTDKKTVNKTHQTNNNNKNTPGKNTPAHTGMEVAVIGMAGRFPGAPNITQFWDNLEKGIESLTFSTREQLEQMGLSPQVLEDPHLVKASGGVLADKEYFDASFFDYSPREAQIMDPQMRVFHECTWEALENAGYDPFTYKGAIGLYAGASSGFQWESAVRQSGIAAQMGSLAAEQLFNKDYLTARIAYKLNLKGSNLTLQSACSTSLLAVHHAVRGLVTGECKMALAGGVSIAPFSAPFYMYREGMILSPDGQCRAFDAKAKGTIHGNGAGVVVLKLLKNALADNDFIYAIIKGTAANNDGSRKAGFTAPSVEGESEAIRKAMRMARVEPGDITYIETHGTATPLGDPVEIEALKKAFKNAPTGSQYCAIGAVKTNIGHLDAAAGIAGLIKTVLALHHRRIPPSLHFETPNSQIDFENSPFYVNTRSAPWEPPVAGQPLRAGVSAFAIGGTNVHAVLEEAPQPSPTAPASPDNGWETLLISARSQKALDQATANLVAFLAAVSDADPTADLADITYTLQVGRRSFEHKRKLVCRDIPSAIEALSDPGSRKVRTFVSKQENKPVIFLFPGLGAQYVNMGRELYHGEPRFRQEMDACFRILERLTGENIKDILFPAQNMDAGGSQAEAARLGTVIQPAVFCLEYALAKCLIEWGIQPHAMMGYSFGEFTAACIAGVFSLEDALKLIVFRDKLVRRIPGGAMLSVPLTQEHIMPLLEEDRFHSLSLAIDNGPSCIVAGPREAVDAFEAEMKTKRLMCMPMSNAHAIHSAMMEPILDEFAAQVSQIALNEPQIPYISNVTGNWITTAEATDPRYWVKHLRGTVRFADGIRRLVEEPGALFVEVGPGNDLSSLITRSLDTHSGQQVLSLVRHPRKKISDRQYLAGQIANLWLYGKRIDWQAIYRSRGETRRRIPLPTYPFQRERYWIDFNPPQATQPANPLPIDLAAGTETVAQMEKHIESTVDIKGSSHYPGFEAIVHRLCTTALLRYVKDCGISTAAGSTFDRDQIKKQLGLLPQFDRFLGFMLMVFLEDGIIQMDGDKGFAFVSPELPPVGDLTASDSMDPVKVKTEGIRLFPQFSGTFESIAYCAGHYADALSGRSEAVKVLYPGGWYFRDAAKYTNKEEYDNTPVYLKLLETTFSQLLLPRLESLDRPIRILEIGGGTGALTRRLVSHLKNRNVEYHFTDLGAFFLVNARKEAAAQGFDFMKFNVLDISKDPQSQGFETGSFDIILGFNVLHAVANISRSTRILEELLVPGGIMALVEGTNPPRWMHMIDGLAEGWWYFEDQDTRTRHPLLPPAQWETVVKREGFHTVSVFPGEEGKQAETRCCLVLAQKAAGNPSAGKIPAPIPSSSVPSETSTNDLFKRPELSASYTAPSDHVEQVLADIFQDFFGIEKIGIDDDFFELGMDSLIATVLASRILERMAVRIPVAEMYNAVVIRNLAEFIRTQGSGIPGATGEVTGADDNMVLLKKGNETGPNLFMVHSGSGEVGAYFRFCSHLDHSINCWGLRSDSPGPGHLAPVAITINERARIYVERIKALQPEGPYNIAGWSGGGAIAFETARLLESAGKTVSFLGIISTTAPQENWGFQPGAFTSFTLSTDIKWIREYFPGDHLEPLLEKAETIEALWEGVIQYIEEKQIPLEMISKLTPRFIADAVPDYGRGSVRDWIYYLNIIRSYINAQALYQPAGKIKAPIYFFDADQEEVANREVWRNYTTGPFIQHKVTGTHHSMFRQPQAEAFANLFNSLLKISIMQA